FAVSGIANLMFLGGWSLGLPWELTDLFGTWVGNLLNVIVFMAKGWFLVFVMMWVRWTLPRLRIDQVMMTCLKYLVPISCALVMGVSVWRLLLPGGVLQRLGVPSSPGWWNTPGAAVSEPPRPQAKVEQA